MHEMTIYKMPDGMKVNTESAREYWTDGNSGETLYRTRRGMYWKTTLDDVAKYVDCRDAKFWLEVSGFELPRELEEL